MKYRKLGSSDLEVSEISLGSWLTYGVGVEADKARACLDEAFAQGINFIDTANVYGRGAAESFLGEALRGRARDSYILATKLYFPMSDSDRGLSRAQVEKQLDASLARLRTDVIDLYQSHWDDEKTPLDETLEALDVNPLVASPTGVVAVDVERDRLTGKGVLDPIVQLVAGHVDVAHRGADVGVAEQPLEARQVAGAGQVAGGVGMPEHVGVTQPGRDDLGHRLGDCLRRGGR